MGLATKFRETQTSCHFLDRWLMFSSAISYTLSKRRHPGSTRELLQTIMCIPALCIHPPTQVSRWPLSKRRSGSQVATQRTESRPSHGLLEVVTGSLSREAEQVL